MIFGTDAGVYPHGDNGRQFAKMVEWGMTPLQAIRAATLNGAEALSMTGDKRGARHHLALASNLRPDRRDYRYYRRLLDS